MQLWNDYEGKTLDGTFPIEALLRTEGRHACFATLGRDGRPAVLRLTEALNDQQEMRARYRAIQDAGQRNLVAINDYGDVELDGTPLIYLVMEPTQESLGDIISERPLSLEETGEVANSLVSALEALHAHGLVHGHVEPGNVLAVGEVIKLRSDCARLAPEAAGGERARAEDVFGLADVLHRCLTQRRLYDASDALALPEPYASIVRNVVRGSWGIDEVAAELRRFVRPAQPAAAPVSDAQAHRMQAPAAGLPPDGDADKSGFASLAVPEPARNGRKPPQSTLATSQMPLLYAPEDASQHLAGSSRPHAQNDEERGEQASSHSGPTPAGRRWREPKVSSRKSRPLLWIAGAVAICSLALLAWNLSVGSRGGKSQTDKASYATTVSAPVAGSPASTAPEASASARKTSRANQPLPAAAPVAPAPQAALAEPAHAASATTRVAPRAPVWRVIAYTYNGEAQAQAKARTIAERHDDLHPEVYSRTGKAPYLVTLGGPLTEQQAASMRARARSEGLARDVYMQNYTH